MAVNLHTTHYRFGINELAESTHGWHAALDTNPAQGVIAVDTTFLLRFTVQETGGTAAGNTDQQFRCALNGGAFQNISTTSTIVKAVTTTVFANGADLTKRLTGTGTFESSGDGGTHDGLSGGPQNDIAASGNSETECALQIVGGDVVHGDVITFALTSPDFTITNDVVPTLTVQELVEITGTGTLPSQASDVMGSGTSLSAGSGVLNDASSAVAGSGVSGSAGTGILEADASTADGSGSISSGISGSGALSSQESDLLGDGLSLSTGSGILESESGSLAGGGVTESVGEGILLIANAILIASGISGSVGTAELLSDSFIIEGQDEAEITGDGEIVMVSASLLALGYVTDIPPVIGIGILKTYPVRLVGYSDGPNTFKKRFQPRL